MNYDTLAASGSLFKTAIDRDIVTNTLDTLNSGAYYRPHGGKSAQSASYDFQKDVLSSYYTEKGLGAIVYSVA
ncbi:MAG: hypothetical protein LBC10_04605 [Deltaproteobacteria bacterium]|jgi:hypothetical protein|nr:hypothetical protein [Deltaproteobacteria bacterium]